MLVLLPLRLLSPPLPPPPRSRLALVRSALARAQGSQKLTSVLEMLLAVGNIMNEVHCRRR